jgi:Tol biopolymer transport system component
MIAKHLRWFFILCICLSWMPTVSALQVGVEGQIAFVSNRDGNDEIYLMNVDGTGLSNLTQHPAADDWPTWSPDGSKLAFVSDRNGNRQIYIMNADGSNVRQLTDSENGARHPVWSPDGQRIAFVSSIFTTEEVSLEVQWVNVDGTELTTVFDGEGYGGRPAWSPDGQELLFDVNPGPAGGFDLMLVNLDGSGLQTVAPADVQGGPAAGTPAWELDAAWSPDGEQIAFVSTRAGGAVNIFVVNRSGSQLQNLTMRGGANAGPVWSPDGRWVAIKAGHGFFIGNPDTSELLRLSERNLGAVDVRKSWSPDGQHIVFEAREDDQFDLFLVAVDGSREVNLTDYPADDRSPDWRPELPRDEGLPPEPEGTIAYIGHDGNVWLMEPDGGNKHPITSEGRYRTPRWSHDGRILAVVRRIEDSPETLEELVLITAGGLGSRRLVLFKGIPGNYPLGFHSLDWVEGDSALLFSIIYSRGPQYALYRVPADAEGAVVDRTSSEEDCLWCFPANGENVGAVNDFRSDSHGTQLIGTRVTGVETGDWATELVRAPVDFAHVTPVASGCHNQVRHPVWSHNGKIISYICNYDSLMVLTLETQGLETVYHDETADLDQWVVWYPDWSPNGEQLVFSRQSFFVPAAASPDGEIWTVNADGSDPQRLGEGAWPAWQPAVSPQEAVDGEPWLAEKQSLIYQLETRDIPTSLFTVAATNGFDEEGAQRVHDQIETKAAEGTLQSDEVEAFARLTLQERAIAELMPAYTTVAATLTDTSVDTLETAMGFLLIIEPAWDICIDQIPGCGRIQQRTNQLIWRLISDVGRNLITLFADGSTEREAFADLWDLLVRLVEDAFLDGQSLLELLLRNAVEAAGTALLVDRLYVAPTQPLLDKGVVSAELDSNSGERWPIEGSTERAELLISSYVEQAQNEEALALDRHQDFQEAADIIKLAEDIADAATLSPAALLAKTVSLGARVEHLFIINAPLITANAGNLECIGYLSQEAAEAAFDADRPFESCRDRNETSLLQIATVHHARAAALPTTTDEGNRYREALAGLQSALAAGEAAEIERAVEELLVAEAAVTWQLDRSLAILRAREPENEAHAPLQQAGNAFSADNIALYLSIVHTRMARQEGYEPEAGIAAVGQDVEASLREIEQLMATMDLSPPATALIVLKDIRAAVEETGNTETSVRLHNVGLGDAERVRVLALGENRETVAEESVGIVPGLGETTVTLNLPADHRDTLLMFQVQSEDRMVDALWTKVENMSSETASIPVGEEQAAGAPSTASDSVPPGPAGETTIESDVAETDASVWRAFAGNWSLIVVISLAGMAVIVGIGLWWRRRSAPTEVLREQPNRFCTHCGAKYPEAGKFCIECGKPREDARP